MDDLTEALLTPLARSPVEAGRAALWAAAEGALRGEGAGALGDALDRPAAVDRQLKHRFRRNRRLGSRDRRLIRRAVFGVLRWRPALERLLRQGGCEAPGDPVALWTAWLVLREGLSAAQAAEGYGAEVFSALERPQQILRAWAAEAGVEERLATLAGLPPWLAGRWLGRWGAEEAAALALAMNRRAPMGLRVNLARTSLVEAAEALRAEGLEVEPAPWPPSALLVHGGGRVSQSPLLRDGRVEIQDPGSQLIAELVRVGPEEVIVDLCSGAGGKALAIAARAPPGATLRAWDVREGALRRAERRARRARSSQRIRFEHIEEEGPLPAPPGGVTQLLIDAPCTGLGTLRRRPEDRWRVTPAEVEAAAARQARLLRRAAPLVRPGGSLIYATCSVLEEENQAVVEAFLRDNPGWTRARCDDRLGLEGVTDDQGDLELLPHRQGCDGFYAAVLERRRP